MKSKSSSVMIGLEIHVPLPTETKLFCTCPNNKKSPPNTNICPTCTGFPGSKPRLNEKALVEAIRVALALNCEIESKTFFARKTYFYPDLPKNYQITQHESAIGKHGHLLLFSTRKKIRIRRVHLEEDPGSLKYASDGRTLIDYNRSGSPLVEIVTEPDFRKIAEVVEFLDLLFAVLRYLGHENPEDNVRCDLNVSLQGGARVEIKNVSGIKTARKSLLFEINKQRKLIKAGKKIKRVTLMVDSERGVTIPVRTKEVEEDYGYIFEPDLRTFNLHERMRDTVLPPLPHQLMEEYFSKHSITQQAEKDLVKEIILAGLEWAKLLELVSPQLGHHKKLLNFIKSLISQEEMNDASILRLREEYFSDFEKLLGMLLKGQTSPKVIEEATIRLATTGERPNFAVLEVSSDELSQARELVERFMRDHPEIKEDLPINPKLVNYVVGQIIRQIGRKELAKLIREEVAKYIETH